MACSLFQREKRARTVSAILKERAYTEKVPFSFQISSFPNREIGNSYCTHLDRRGFCSEYQRVV